MCSQFNRRMCNRYTVYVMVTIKLDLRFSPVGVVDKIWFMVQICGLIRNEGKG